MKKIIAITVTILFLVGCSVQKRRYTTGFYLPWKGTHSLGLTQEARNEKRDLNKKAAPQQCPKEIRQEAPVFASAGPHPIYKSQTNKMILGPDSCDELIFRDGSEVKGRVSEVGLQEIKYKRCDLPDGPLYTTKKSEIFMVKYANGTREVFKDERPVSNAKEKTSGKKKVHPLATTAFVFAALGFTVLSVLGGLLAILFSYLAERKIRQQPDVYEGRGTYRAARIMGFVSVGLFALMLLVIFALALI